MPPVDRGLNTESRRSLPVDRTIDRDRSRSTAPVNQCVQTCTASLAGGPVDRPGRPPRELCSLDPASVDWAVDRWHNDQKSYRWHNGRKSDSWSVDRAVDRQQSFLLSCPQQLVFRAYLYAAILGSLIQDFKKFLG